MKPPRLRLVASSRTVVLRLQKTIAVRTSLPRRRSRSTSFFLRASTRISALVDQCVGRGRARHLDRLRIGEEAVGQLLDRRRHGRREQQGLAGRRKLGADFLDVGDEAHVEHPVGLVDDEQSAAGQQYLAAAEQVHQPAGRGDQHVDALFERRHLVAHADSADQQRHAELVIFAVFLEILGDLGGELAGRLEDQGARHPRPAPALGEDVDHRQDEAGGLAGAGLGDSDQVAVHQDRGDRLALDRGGLVIAGFLHGAEQFVGEAEIGKGHS